jgi:hypothetical protein
MPSSSTPLAALGAVSEPRRTSVFRQASEAAAFVRASAGESAEVDAGEVAVPDVAFDISNDVNDVLAHFGSRAGFVPDERFWAAASKVLGAADCEEYLQEMHELCEEAAYLQDLLAELGQGGAAAEFAELESELPGAADVAEEYAPVADGEDDTARAGEDAAQHFDDESLLGALAAELESPEAGADATEEDVWAAAAARATAEAAERMRSATGSDVDVGEPDVRGCGGTPVPRVARGALGT